MNATLLYTPRVAKLGSALFCRTSGLTTVHVCGKTVCVYVFVFVSKHQGVCTLQWEINELTVRAVGESDPLGR